MSGPLSGQVVVLTGASSGVGRAAAAAFARRGATVVLAARRVVALHAVAQECLEAGGRAMVVPTDVTDPGQVQALAQRALDAFGGIDVWVNNAGVTLFGRFEDLPDELFERVIRTNLFGTAYGAHAVLPHFRDRGSGILINHSSMLAVCPQPFVSAYNASKFAIRGLSETLRQELLDQPGIQVCTVLSESIDTPLWQQAGNLTGHAVKPLDPVYPPERVAELMVDLVHHPRREVFAGSVGRLLALQHALAPAATERVVARLAPHSLLQDRPAAATPGNLLRPVPEETGVSGGWLQPGQRTLPAPEALAPVLWAGMAAAGLLLLGGWAALRPVRHRPEGG